MNEYLFDVKLLSSLRVRAASEVEARLKIAELLDCASANFGELDGQPVIGEASIDGEAYLIETNPITDYYRDRAASGQAALTAHR
ncbi:hypothetical protein NX905_21080 [Burkholderia thailandensis]|uniref:hypothetical protein n=1 Tax=Burkholderia thailandensis TaxID=57975 RepID=UPI00217E9057|nr:hypothetical protein [Burkholderia thailandensis]MCS6496740.1 hypothetical protein [Burkholderia thailandensis]